MKIRGRHLVAAAGLAVLIAVVARALRPSAVSVETSAVERGTVRVTIDEDGQTRVRERYVISAPVTGRMVRLECDVGDAVAAGEVIARIYPMPLDTRARADVAARMEAAEALLQAALARREQAEALWHEATHALERLERVQAEVPGAVAEQHLDRTRTAERSAALELEQARSAAEAVAHEVESARSALLGAEGGLDAEPTLVRAPAAGRVLRLYEDCERAVAAGSPIVEIGDPEDLEVVVDVLTQDAARLQVGATALVTVGPEADTLVGSISLVEPSAFTRVSPLGVEEQRVNVIVTFGDRPVFLGDRYRVDAALVVWEAEDVVRVPMSALFRVEKGWGVFVLDGGRAVLRTLELGERGRRDAEVRSGLSEGERVVLYPPADLVDGARVDQS